MTFNTLPNPVFRAKLYEIFNRHGRKIGEQNAESAAEALRLAKEQFRTATSAVLKNDTFERESGTVF